MHYPEFNEAPLEIPFGTSRKAHAALLKSDAEYKKKLANYLLVIWSLVIIIFMSSTLSPSGVKEAKLMIVINITGSIICACIIIALSIRHWKYQKWRMAEWIKLRNGKRA